MRTTTTRRAAAPALALVAAVALAGCGDDSTAAGDDGEVQLSDVAVEGGTNDGAAAEDGEEAVSALEGDQTILPELDSGDEGGDEGADGDVAVNLVGETVTVSGPVTEVISESAVRLAEGDGSVVVLDLDGPLADSGLAATDDLADEQAVVEVTGTVERYLLTELQEIADVLGPGYDDPAALDELARENVILVDSISLLEE